MGACITDDVFADIYIGLDFADVVGLDGNSERIAVPARYREDIEALRKRCVEMTKDGAAEEFSIKRRNLLLRVTSFSNTDGNAVYMIRRPSATILPVRQIGFGSTTLDFLLNKDLRGLVLFCGEMRSGKTSAAASYTKARLEEHGGTAIVIEDPPETALDGVHGKGRCIQVEVAGPGGYRAQLKKAMRSGAGLIYLGEVRDQEAASQVATASINGHLIASTIHALTAKDAIMRLATLCSGAIDEPEKILASGLAAVIHLQLVDHEIRTAGGMTTIKRLSYQMLNVAGDPLVQNVIRQKNWHQLDNLLDLQAARQRSGAK